MNFIGNRANAQLNAAPMTDGQQAEQLSALGYVTAGSVVPVRTKVEGADPKGRIETRI